MRSEELSNNKDNGSNNPCLGIQNLSVNIGGQALLDQVTFSIPHQKITTIIGANGAGKSTALKAIMGDIQITQGAIEFHNTSIENLRQKLALAKNIAHLSQFSSLNFPFTAYEVVKLGRMPHETGEKIDDEITQQCLSALDISELQNSLYPLLSGGEKQRVQLARVLAQVWRHEDSLELADGSKSRLLILDEPCSSLDLGHQQQFMQLLTQLSQQQMTVLLVKHNLNTAANYSDYLIGLKQGKLICEGSPEQIINKSTIHDLFGIDCQIVENPQTGMPNVLE